MTGNRILTNAQYKPPEPREARVAWPDERIDMLKKLWAEGYSASQIAAKLGPGVTRNAVIGKIHRLKDLAARPEKPAPIDAPRAPRNPHALAIGHKKLNERGRVTTRKGDKRAAIEHTAPAHERFAEGYLGQHGKVALLDLISGQCRFPIDQADGSLKYCGDPVADHSSYCTHHHQRCCPGDCQPAAKARPPFEARRVSLARI